MQALRDVYWKDHPPLDEKCPSTMTNDDFASPFAIIASPHLPFMDPSILYSLCIQTIEAVKKEH